MSITNLDALIAAADARQAERAGAQSEQEDAVARTDRAKKAVEHIAATTGIGSWVYALGNTYNMPSSGYRSKVMVEIRHEGQKPANAKLREIRAFLAELDADVQIPRQDARTVTIHATAWINEVEVSIQTTLKV